MKLVCKSWRESISSLDENIISGVQSKYGISLHMDDIIHQAMMSGDILTLDLLLNGYSQPLHIHPIGIFMLALDSRVEHPDIPNVLYPLMRKTINMYRAATWVAHVCLKFQANDISESLNLIAHTNRFTTNIHTQASNLLRNVMNYKKGLSVPDVTYTKVLPRTFEGIIFHDKNRVIYDGYDIEYAILMTSYRAERLPAYINVNMTNILLGEYPRAEVIGHVISLDRIDILRHILSRNEWRFLHEKYKLSWISHTYICIYLKSHRYPHPEYIPIDNVMYPCGWRDE